MACIFRVFMYTWIFGTSIGYTWIFGTSIDYTWLFGASICFMSTLMGGLYQENYNFIRLNGQCIRMKLISPGCFIICSIEGVMFSRFKIIFAVFYCLCKLIIQHDIVNLSSRIFLVNFNSGSS